jgi:hypothetical protein
MHFHTLLIAVGISKVLVSPYVLTLGASSHYSFLIASFYLLKKYYFHFAKRAAQPYSFCRAFWYLQACLRWISPAPPPGHQ